MKWVLDGCHAVSHAVQLARVGVISAYPITLKPPSWNIWRSLQPLSRLTPVHPGRERALRHGGGNWFGVYGGSPFTASSPGLA
jgi:hypothetical protein